MITVTLPNGRNYTFAARNASRARALAARTGGTVSLDSVPVRRGPARCPHGDVIGECDRGACDEGWDY